MTRAARDRWAAGSCTGHLHQVGRGLSPQRYRTYAAHKRGGVLRPRLRCSDLRCGYLDLDLLGPGSTTDLRNRHGDTPAEGATTGKALVRAVARGRGVFPGGVRQCSVKRCEPRIRPFRGTRKEREETAVGQFEDQRSLIHFSTSASTICTASASVFARRKPNDNGLTESSRLDR
jgi:hypothetical protein